MARRKDSVSLAHKMLVADQLAEVTVDMALVTRTR